MKWKHVIALLQQVVTIVEELQERSRKGDSDFLFYYDMLWASYVAHKR